MRNKRGWMRILEATIAVLIVAGVLVVVYSRQEIRGVDQTDYFYNLQRQILMDVSSRSNLRLAVLKTENVNDDYFDVVNDFIRLRIPEAFNYTIRICELTSPPTPCKINDDDYIATLDKDVFVEEVVISSDLGNQRGEEYYAPKKLRLFVWELR